MQCLYCDKELKPFRGLFDEDFCCREHREKYFSSFRKALTGFGGFGEAAKNPGSLVPAPAAPAREPRVADFLPLPLVAVAGGAVRDGHRPEPLAAVPPVEIARRDFVWIAALDSEERAAELTVASEGTFASLEPAPAPQESSVGFTQEWRDKPAALSLDTAGPAAPGESDSVSGCYSLWMFDEPLAVAPAELSLPCFAASADVARPAPSAVDEYAELIVFCADLPSSAVPAGEIVPAHEAQIPAFTPLCVMLQSEQEPEPDSDATEPYWGELYQDPEPAGVEFGPAPSVAPEMLWSSVPVDRLAPVQTNVPAMMPLGLELAAARSANVPALSSIVEPKPALAPELATEFADGEAADSSASPRSHEPLRLSFGNLVKIKNWRLRITFAKPA